MSSKREEEKNEKIIRGLMKLPPNRRCINCNSLGPQYVCTNFWTFICTPCSGIHREFTHRVKSVSMANFTSQEVDSLQKGGNQRARELYLKSWDLQRQKHPDNSNVDNVREFIKNVYVNKKYALEKSPNRPPRDPQGLGNHEEERRASSYHSYSQSPPYDFQYEERRYGKHAASLTRKPGSDRGLYEGKISSFLSPSRFSDHANDDSSQRDTGSPFNDTSRNMTTAFPGHHAARHNSDFRSNGGRILHPQRTVSSGSFSSFDSNSMSLKSFNSMDLPDVASEPEVSAEVSHSRFSSFPFPTQSWVSGTFSGLDLFSAPFAPQDVTSTPSSGINSQLPESLTQSVHLFQQSSTSAVSTFTEQQELQVTQPSSSDLFPVLCQQQSAASSEGKASNVVIPNNGGWETFGLLHSGPNSTENSANVATEQSSNEKIPGSINPFSVDQISSYSTGHEPTAFTHTFQHQGLEKSVTRNSTHFWNAFEDLAPRRPIQSVLNSNEQVAEHCAKDAGGYVGFSGYEVLNDNVSVRALDQSEPSCSSLPSHFSMPLHNLAMVPPVAGVHPIAPDYKPNNPFDQPYDSDMEPTNMSQFWDMTSLQAALPSTQMPASYVGDHSNSCFPQDSTLSYVPGGVAFDHPHFSGSLGLMYVEAPTTQLSNIPAQGPVAPVGGNPFA